MGVFASTNAEITCDSEKTAKEVYFIIDKITIDEQGNFELGNIDCGGNQIYFDLQSGRVQNLEWQCEEIWNKIKDIKGVETMSCPFMVEEDGKYFTKEDNQ